MMHLLTGQCNATAPLVSMVMPVWQPHGRNGLLEAVRSVLAEDGSPRSS